jgi:hypothetical protein
MTIDRITKSRQAGPATNRTSVQGEDGPGSRASEFGTDSAEVFVKANTRTGGRQPVAPTAAPFDGIMHGERCPCTNCT